MAKISGAKFQPVSKATIRRFGRPASHVASASKYYKSIIDFGKPVKDVSLNFPLSLFF